MIFRRNMTPPSSVSNNKQSKNHHEIDNKLIFRPWKWWRHIPPKRRFTFNRLQTIIFQKTLTLRNSSTSVYVQRGPTESIGPYAAGMRSQTARLTGKWKCALVEWEFAVGTEVPREYLLQSQFVHHKSYVNWLGIKLGPPRWETRD
jgi:hypothetical protein